jgi:leucine dehydrogenase
MAYAAHGAPVEEYVRLDDPRSGLSGIIAIHSTVLGPGAGGCRFWHYPDEAAAAVDAFRLAEGMSYKNALAGLPFGGAKAVLRMPERPFDRDALFRAFGRAVRALEGRYVTAEDVGTRVRDMEVIAEETCHVAGRPAQAGVAGGDPSPWTALGVFQAMAVGARHAFDADLSELTVAVQGTGSVGGILCRMLADAGARLILADVDPGRRDRLAAIHGAKVVDVGEIATAEADIFAPCALGAVLDEASVAAMPAKLICGAANNQLANAEIAAMLLDRGVTYVPDYVANAGGIINVAAEYLGESPLDVEARVLEIGPRVGHILEQAKRERMSPADVADRLARDAISSAAQLAA